MSNHSKRQRRAHRPRTRDVDVPWTHQSGEPVQDHLKRRLAKHRAGGCPGPWRVGVCDHGTTTVVYCHGCDQVVYVAAKGGPLCSHALELKPS